MKKLLVLLLVAAAALTLTCGRKGWRIWLRVGQGRVEGTSLGSRVAVFVGVTDDDGLYPVDDVPVTLENLADGVTIPLTVKALKTWSGWVYYNDSRVWPESDIEATCESPGPTTITDSRHYGGGAAALDYPALELELDTLAREVRIGIAAVAGARAYRLWLGRYDDPFNRAWSSGLSDSPFADTVPLDTLQTGQQYTLWGLVSNLDLVALEADPTALKSLPANALLSLGKGPELTAP
ncbi:hypothetical protein JXB37_03635 [candidate division WOR-3 bacterium]|nr:hypothetical protein [candidate division WOR-3 bacterium]